MNHFVVPISFAFTLAHLSGMLWRAREGGATLDQQ